MLQPPVTVVRILRTADFDAFREMRRAGLAAGPAAFATWETDWHEASDEAVRQLLGRSGTADSVILGAFDGSLAGLVGVRRESKTNSRHKAAIWGRYVSAEQRRRGTGRLLVEAAVDHARTTPGLRMLRISAAATAEPALRLFETVGFRVYGVEPGGRLTPDGTSDIVYLYLPLGERPLDVS